MDEFRNGSVTMAPLKNGDLVTVSKDGIIWIDGYKYVGIAEFNGERAHIVVELGDAAHKTHAYRYCYKRELPKLKRNQILRVWNATGIVYVRCFSHFDATGKVHCYDNGVEGFAADFTPSSPWDHYDVVETR